MKLNLVPARHGFQWVTLGIRTYLRQPLALSGLFFVYMAVMIVLSLVPVLGPVVGLVITPAATLGMLVATKEAADGRFPMPTVLAAAFRAGQQRLRSMLQLGFIYAVCVQALMLLGYFIVGPQPQPQSPTDVNGTTLLLTAIVMPVIIAFWFAPALVHWHGVTPVKSIFFSLVAVFGNFKAFVVYALTWFALTALLLAVVGTVVSLVGGGVLAPAVMVPLVLVMSVMFIASTYFSFVDSFRVDAPSPPTPAPHENETPHD